MERLPSVFISHGSPTHAPQSAFSEVWSTLGRSLPKPVALLITSAQWQTRVPMLSGALGLAQRARNLLGDAGFVAGIDGLRGLDRGAWAPLLRLYEMADVPIAQLSVQPALSPGHHLDLGKALRNLSEEGVLVVGSAHLADEYLHPFFIALGVAGERARPERLDGIESGALAMDAYIIQ